jgi:SAM-dependent methyltransferase
VHRPADEIYLHGHHPHVVDAHARRTASEAAAFLLPRLSSGMRLLDLGCGPGSITAGLVDEVAPGIVVGVDRDPGVLGRAARGSAGARYLAADAYRLPFRPGSFDGAYAHQVLQHLVDPVAALEEVRRVLVPGGVLGVRDADYGTMTHAPTEPLIDRLFEIFRTVAHDRGATPEAGRHLLGWVLEAGFVDPVVTTSTWTYADEAGRREWADLWAGRTGTSTFSSMAVEAGVTTREELEAISAAWRRWAERPDGFFTFVHGEVVAVASG